VLLPVPVATPDWSRPQHHHFNLGTMRLALLLFVQVRISFRGIDVVLALLAAWRSLDLGQPSFATVRQWLYRVGLFLLRQTLPAAAAGWVVIIDHTIQLGTRQCCLVLGLPVAALRATGYALAHQHVRVLALQVLTHATGTQVLAVLQEVHKQVGRIVQIVADHGSDLCNGIRRLQQDQPWVVATYDVRHLLATLLKAELRDDPVWAQLLSGCAGLLPKWRQTLANFLTPPTLRLKARYMNVASHVQWAQQVLAWSCRGAWAELGAALGKTAAEAQAWFAEHLGWLEELREPLRDYQGLMQVVDLAEEQVHQQGLSRHTASLFWQQWLGVAGEARWRVWQFARRVHAALAEEGERIPAGETWLGSSLVIESLFAKYKALAARGPSGEMGLEVLALPVLTSELSNAVLREALETVSWQDVQQWQAEHLDKSAAARKRRLLGTSEATATASPTSEADHNVA
jgi:hypothetical protein